MYSDNNTVMNNDKRVNPVYRALNKTQEILGVDLSLFVTAVGTALSFYVLFSSLLGGIAILSILIYLARKASHEDPKLLVFLLMSGRFHREYDAYKYRVLKVQRIHHRA